MDKLGKSPIPVPMLITGKLALFFSLLFFLAKRIGIEMLYDGPATQIISMVLTMSGGLLVIFGFVYLGKSISVGLPQEKTELKTGGIYRFTRNPLYFGAYLACIGSCLYSIHIVNFLLCITGIGIHHWIVTKEEKFLGERFGKRWLEYKERVPRYGPFQHTPRHNERTVQ